MLRSRRRRRRGRRRRPGAPSVSVADFYGRWAAVYDRVATAPGIGRWRRAAAERVARPGDTVVEMGCGTGANLPYLRERVGPAGRVVGVDLAGPPLRRARDRAGRDGDDVAVVRGDATDPPVATAAAGAPGSGPGDVLRAPFGRPDEPLSRRVAASRAALADRAEARRYETFGLGFVGLLSGRVR
ncbi:alkanonic acid methyltransferase [Halobacteriales archaeon QS_9_70_65]|nr:MAG: alkanonic acid methyltransferase [Halobacteriales archaeon QS_9_70_65]